jgi:hypothetical protein
VSGDTQGPGVPLGLTTAKSEKRSSVAQPIHGRYGSRDQVGVAVEGIGDSGTEPKVVRLPGERTENGEGVPTLRVLIQPKRIESGGVSTSRVDPCPLECRLRIASSPGQVIEGEAELHASISLSGRAVIENQTAWSFIASATGNTFRSVVHGERVAAFDRLSLFLRNDRGEEIVFGTGPDAGKTVDRAHPVTVAWVCSSNLAEWIGTGRLLCFHKCNWHSFQMKSNLT